MQMYYLKLSIGVMITLVRDESLPENLREEHQKLSKLPDPSRKVLFL